VLHCVGCRRGSTPTHSGGLDAHNLFLSNFCGCHLLLGSTDLNVSCEHACETCFIFERPTIGNVPSSTKPEIHNVMQRRQQMTEPRPREQYARKIWRSSNGWFLRYACGQTQTNRDGQADGHTHRNTSLLCRRWVWGNYYFTKENRDTC